LKAADQIVDEMMDRMLCEMSPKKSNRVGVLVNSLGSAPLMEL